MSEIETKRPGEFRVLICGGRESKDRRQAKLAQDEVVRILGALEPMPTRLIHGAATGVDAYADDWARMWGIDVREYPANWARDGWAAGPIRNAKMLKDEDPDLVIVFPGGRDTTDMRERAVKGGYAVVDSGSL